MHIIAPIAFGLGLLGLASAAPAPEAATGPKFAAWSVSYDAGCGTSPEGCAYTVNISAPTQPSIPGFKTTCFGANVDKKPNLCRDKNIETFEKLREGKDEYLMVRQGYVRDSCQYYVTGYHFFPGNRGFKNKGLFVIHPNETYAVC